MCLSTQKSSVRKFDYIDETYAITVISLIGLLRAETSAACVQFTVSMVNDGDIYFLRELS